jgi:hypothetical protein
MGPRKLARGEGAVSLTRALVAYRLTMLDLLGEAAASFGAETVLHYFAVSAIEQLGDATAPTFVDTRRLSKFYKYTDQLVADRARADRIRGERGQTNKGRTDDRPSRRRPDSNDLISAMYERLRQQKAVHKLRVVFTKSGQSEVADDIVFFLEHRLRLGRSAVQGEKVSTAQKNADAYQAAVAMLFA